VVDESGQAYVLTLEGGREMHQDQVSDLSTSGLCGVQELFTPTGAAARDAGKFRNRKWVGGLGLSVLMRRWRARCESSLEHGWVMTSRILLEEGCRTKEYSIRRAMVCVVQDHERQDRLPMIGLERHPAGPFIFNLEVKSTTSTTLAPRRKYHWGK